MGSHKTTLETVAADIAALRSVVAAQNDLLLKVLDAIKEPQPASFTQDEFRARHQLSESQYHRLLRDGRGPRRMHIGKNANGKGQRISRQAEADWIAEGEAASAQTKKERQPDESHRSVPAEHGRN